MQICEIYFKSIYNECVIYVLLTIFIIKVTTQHPMGISNRLTVVLQQELH